MNNSTTTEKTLRFWVNLNLNPPIADEKGDDDRLLVVIKQVTEGFYMELPDRTYIEHDTKKTLGFPYPTTVQITDDIELVRAEVLACVRKNLTEQTKD